MKNLILAFMASIAFLFADYSYSQQTDSNQVISPASAQKICKDLKKGKCLGITKEVIGYGGILWFSRPIWSTTLKFTGANCEHFEAIRSINHDGNPVLLIFEYSETGHELIAHYSINQNGKLISAYLESKTGGVVKESVLMTSDGNDSVIVVKPSTESLAHFKRSIDSITKALQEFLAWNG